MAGHPPGRATLVLAPMVREARPLARSLGMRPVAVGGGRAWDGPAGVLAVVGVGGEPATARTTELVTSLRPVRVLVAGVCGALDPALSVGDLVVPDRVVDAAGGTEWTPHRAGRPGRPGATGTLATVARFGDPVPPGAVAVDMETAAIAAACEDMELPWDVRRTVSDVPGTLDPEVAALMGPGGGVDAAALARLLLAHPGRVGTLVQLGRQFRTAVTELCRAVATELAAHG